MYGGRNVGNIMGWDKFKCLTPAQTLDWETVEDGGEVSVSI